MDYDGLIRCDQRRHAEREGTTVATMLTVDQTLTLQEQDLLLKTARTTAEDFLAKKALRFENEPRISHRNGGVFVTLTAGRDLRGCVGTFAPSVDLTATVRRVTCMSLEDPRFADNPVAPSELDGLVLEISILSELQRSHDPLSLILGTHGIMIRTEQNSGCFLPKVAIDRKWTAEEFLCQCSSMKAGLARFAWRDDPGTQVYTFTCQVFSDRSRAEPWHDVTVS